MVWPWLPLAFGNSLGHGIALPRPGHSSMPQTCGSAPWHTSWHTSCAWNDILAEESKAQKSDILMEIPHLRSPSCLKIIYWVYWDVTAEHTSFPEFPESKPNMPWRSWLRQLRREIEGQKVATCRHKRKWFGGNHNFKTPHKIRISSISSPNFQAPVCGSP